MAVVQKSPIFCSSVPDAEFFFAADSLIVRSWSYTSSRTTLPMPHADSEAGIGLRFNHPPFAYAKKSSPGLMDVSISMTRTSGFGFAAVGCGAGLLQPAIIASARPTLHNHRTTLLCFMSTPNTDE